MNLPKSTLQPFQRIQNLTAKIILGRSKYSSATEALKELHILPVHIRAEYKLLVLVYKCLNNLAPSYLSDLISKQQAGYATRSTKKNLLVVPFVKNKTFADRSFSVAGPRLWNALPEIVKTAPSVDTFKTRLKTHLFTKTFLLA